MTVKLVLLKSNEEVIADVKELVDENDKPIFVVLENAYCCKLVEDPVLLTVVMPVICWYTGIQPPSLLLNKMQCR